MNTNYQWLEDRERGLYEFNHFYFCYINPEHYTELLVLVRMEGTYQKTSDAFSYYCPVLEEKFNIGDDFRTALRRSVKENAGFKENPNLECYKLCPNLLRLKKANVLFGQKNNMALDISTSWWLPQPVKCEWMRGMKSWRR